MYYYKDRRRVRTLPNKVQFNNATVFNPKWKHYEQAGWKHWPVELEGVPDHYIKWVGDTPTEMTQVEKDGVDAQQKAQRIEQQMTEVVRLYEEVEKANTTSIGTVMLMQWSQAGLPKSVAVAEWFTALYDERDSKLALLDSGTEVDPTPSLTVKPYTFRQMREEVVE